VQYFNIYAFTEMAIYGRSYVNSAKMAWDLLRNRGIDALVNDNLVGSALFLGALLSGLICGGITALLAKYAMNLQLWVTWAFVAFAIGFTMAMVGMSVASSAVTCFFVCIAEDIHAFGENHYEEYQQLTDRMHEAYPTLRISPVYNVDHA